MLAVRPALRGQSLPHRLPRWPRQPGRLLPPCARRGRQPLDGGSPGSDGRGLKSLSELDTSSLQSLEDTSCDRPPHAGPPWRQQLEDLRGRLTYSYFNWRQDTWSDLQLFILLNVAFFTSGAVVQGMLLRGADSTTLQPPEDAGVLQRMWWDLYQVLAVVLGQQLPEAHAGWPYQLFAIIVATVGLGSFALVVALTEQFVLEVLERNVQRGSMCYEQGHSVVLAWCESSRDVAQLTRILTQLCAANRASGGGVVVVLTQQRGKLEMEQLFREVVPLDHRFNSRFVFRQGSPLDPSSLHMVAAPAAQRIIVCSDYSRPALEADAQVLRACVLLDEMVQQEVPEGQGGPTIVAQVKTEDSLALMQFACSRRIIPVPTNRVNARRFVRLLHNPIATMLSRALTDFYSPAHAFFDRVPEVEGCAFGELFARFPDAVVVGLHNSATGKCRLNPPPEDVVEPGDCLIVLRPGKFGALYTALPEALPADPGPGWDPNRYIMRSLDEQPLGTEAADSYRAISAQPRSSSARAAVPGSSARREGSRPPSRSPSRSPTNGRGPEMDQDSRRGLFVLPVQYSNPQVPADELLICGWMSQTFMWSLLAELDHSDQGLPAGSRVTLFNSHNWTPEHLEARCQQYGICRLEVRHVKGDPRSRSDMQRLIDVSKFKAAIVVCDSTWSEGAAPNAEGGVQLLTHAEMLSLDAAMLTVQLNIRLLLEEAQAPAISIICEKLTYLGTTRFEDDTQPPLGIAINSASYAAKALTKVAVEPRFLSAYMQLGVESDLLVQDASAFAGEGEELSFLQLQARAASVRQVLMGYYVLPASASEPLELVVNPQGVEGRSVKRVWNTGDCRTKLVTLSVARRWQAQQAQRAALTDGTAARTHGNGADFASV